MVLIASSETFAYASTFILAQFNTKTLPLDVPKANCDFAEIFTIAIATPPGIVRAGVLRYSAFYNGSECAFFIFRLPKSFKLAFDAVCCSKAAFPIQMMSERDALL